MSGISWVARHVQTKPGPPYLFFLSFFGASCTGEVEGFASAVSHVSPHELGVSMVTRLSGTSHDLLAASLPVILSTALEVGEVAVSLLEVALELSRECLLAEPFDDPSSKLLTLLVVEMTGKR